MSALDPASPSPAGAAQTKVPLGPDFVRAQLAQLISLIADHSLMWILVWWLIATRKEATAGELTTLLTSALALPLLALPLAGTLSDLVERKRVVFSACLLRALLHLAVALMLYTGTLTVERGAVCMLLSAGAGSFFDATLTAMLPQLVPPGQAERALDYSLALPRAGYFITSFIMLLLIAMLGERLACALGVGFLLIAAALCSNIERSTQPEPAAAASLAATRLGRAGGALVEGLLIFLRSPRLLVLAGLAGLANFVMYPLFWLGPASMATGGKLPKRLPENIEVLLVLGVVAGALATPRLCQRYGEERVAGAGLLGLALGLAALGQLHQPTLLYATASALGFALVQVTGLASGAATLLSPDSHRARVTALVLLTFELGGELGGLTLHPLIAAHGLPSTLLGLAAGLALLALPWLLLPSQRLPGWLRFGVR